MDSADAAAPSRARKVGATGAVLAAVTTIAVAAINVLPQIRSPADPPPKPPVAQEIPWQIVGRLSSIESPGEPVEGEVLLIPAGSPYLTTTDSQGKFLFQGVQPGGYWILVRHKESGLDARVLVDAEGRADTQTVSLPGGIAAMGISLEPETRAQGGGGGPTS